MPGGVSCDDPPKFDCRSDGGADGEAGDKDAGNLTPHPCEVVRRGGAVTVDAFKAC